QKYPVFSVSEIKDLDFDRIFIANVYLNTVEETLAVGIPEEKIFITIQSLYEEYRSKYPDGKIKFALTSMLTQKLQSRKILGSKIAELDGNFFIVAQDGFRIGTLQLLAEEIQNQKIPGEIAELGVFRGEFAKYLNELFPDRTLNLFDTFEGFADQQENHDRQSGLVAENMLVNSSYLKNTTVDLVMSKMKHPERVKIYKGFFPDTIPSEEKQFALVSLDPDLYQPTIDGLRYFYPRLLIGGFIMIHDYNNAQFNKSIHRSVEDFELEVERLIKIPIADNDGTLIITK
ncbi:MAG: hypothetical protein IJ575_00875, partial [Selenomonadaceae bacterium]|nr:hypothetical protein [Selenomonadaceae bacterium]